MCWLEEGVSGGNETKRENEKYLMRASNRMDIEITVKGIWGKTE